MPRAGPTSGTKATSDVCAPPAAKWFEGRGYSVQSKYPYILAERDQWPANIIVPEVASFITSAHQACEARGAPFPLHKYIHHGLSSQAMLFNLVGPLSGAAGSVTPANGVLTQRESPGRGTTRPSPSRSKIGPSSTRTAASPLPLIWCIAGNGSAPRLYIEAKLVEREFGGCSVFEQGDCDGMNPAADLPLLLPASHRTRVLAVYGGARLLGWAGCTESCLPAWPGTTSFSANSCLLSHKGGYFVLLDDCRNPTFVAAGSNGGGAWAIAFSDFALAKPCFAKGSGVSLIQDLSLSSGRHPITTTGPPSLRGSMACDARVVLAVRGRIRPTDMR